MGRTSGGQGKQRGLAWLFGGEEKKEERDEESWWEKLWGARSRAESSEAAARSLLGAGGRGRVPPPLRPGSSANWQPGIVFYGHSLAFCLLSGLAPCGISASYALTVSLE